MREDAVEGADLGRSESCSDRLVADPPLLSEFEAVLPRRQCSLARLLGFRRRHSVRSMRGWCQPTGLCGVATTCEERLDVGRVDCLRRAGRQRRSRDLEGDARTARQD